jgi:hypothetical protein
MRNASIGKLRLRPLRKCSGAWKRVKTVDWNPSDAHQTSGVRHITVANLQFDPFPRFRAPAGENSRQLAQFAVNRGPAPARSRFQPFSFCARSLLSAFCFPNFCFSLRRAQDQFQSPVRPEECDARRLGVEEFIKTGMSRPGLLRLLSGDKGIQTLGNSQGMTARPCRR